MRRVDLAIIFSLGYLIAFLVVGFAMVKKATATPILHPWPYLEQYVVSTDGKPCPRGYRPLYKGHHVVILNRNYIPAHSYKPWPRVPGTMCFPDSPSQPLPMAAVTTIVGSFQQACTQCVQP